MNTDSELEAPTHRNHGITRFTVEVSVICTAQSLIPGFIKQVINVQRDEVRKRANPADYGDNIRTSGDELAFTPKESASLWTTWQFDSGLTLGLGVQHVGDSWAGRPDDASRIIPNGTFGKLPGYTIGNAMASYTFNQNLTLRLNVNNITDELYATSTNWPANRVLLGTARSAVLSADIHF